MLMMIAGGAESTVSPLGMGACAARALSTRNDDPADGQPSWDKDRDGFVLGEGAGVLVLEEYEHAKARGAKIYAEVAGLRHECGCLPHHCADMGRPRRSMVNALKNAGVTPADVQYVNARHVDAAWRQERVGCHQGGLWATLQRASSSIRPSR